MLFKIEELSDEYIDELIKFADETDVNEIKIGVPMHVRMKYYESVLSEICERDMMSRRREDFRRWIDDQH